MEEGKKYDQGKLRYDLVPVEAHEGLAEVFTYGSIKYGDNNWQQVESERYVAALFRHLNAWRKGEKHDEESGYHHLKHALTNVAILLYKDTCMVNKDIEQMLEDINARELEIRRLEIEHEKNQELEARKERYFTGNGTNNI